MESKDVSGESLEKSKRRQTVVVPLTRKGRSNWGMVTTIEVKCSSVSNQMMEEERETLALEKRNRQLPLFSRERGGVP